MKFCMVEALKPLKSQNGACRGDVFFAALY
jgi:hypothetical protein